MSADDIPEQTQKRLRRLKAMQSKHADGEAPAEAAAPARAPGRGAGLLASLQGAGQQKAPGGMMQKLRKALSGPDGAIDQQKARAFLMFVRKQAADPQAPRHQMATQIVGKLKTLPPQQRQRLLAAAGLGGGGALGGALGGGLLGGGAAAPQAAVPEAPDAQAHPAPTGEAWFDDLVAKL